MSCSICLEPINEDNLEVTECNHRFHHICLQRWFERSNSCPLCRHLLRNQPIEEIEEGEIDDGIDDGFDDEPEIVYYNVSEMLPIYDIFQAICMNYIMEIDNEARRANPRRLPAYFQHMMEILPEQEFEMIHQDQDTVEIIYQFLNGQFDSPEPLRYYCYDSEYDPPIARILNVYESFAQHRQHGYYEAFERFLNALRTDEEFLLFRTRMQHNLFERYN